MTIFYLKVYHLKITTDKKKNFKAFLKLNVEFPDKKINFSEIG